MSTLNELRDRSTKESSDPETELVPNYDEFKPQIVWSSVLKLFWLHVSLLAVIPVIPFAHNATIFFSYILLLLAVLGIQIGAHRFWAHRTFKANFTLRLIFAICQTVSLQNDIYQWVRDHRVHHKWSDTSADPHNSNRGFFFSHMGWLMVKKHPEVLKKGATLDLSDLEADPIVMLQRKYYRTLWVPLFWAIIPTFVPVLFWGESMVVSFLVCVVLRYAISLHVTWLVNSWAHAFGNKPYNKELVPVEASIRHVLMGEGFHNYHHAFPWDYSASELGPLDVFNPATAIIDFFAAMGWAWDLKKPDRAVIEKTVEKTGEPSLTYRKGLGRGLYEWFSGLAVMTSVLWIQLLYKYVVLYFYYMIFDWPISFDVVSLSKVGQFLVTEFVHETGVWKV